jgi:hypothetical protein
VAQPADLLQVSNDEESRIGPFGPPPPAAQRGLRIPATNPGYESQLRIPATNPSYESQLRIPATNPHPLASRRPVVSSSFALPMIGNALFIGV